VNVDSYVIGDDYTSPWDFKPFQRYAVVSLCLLLVPTVQCRYKGDSRNVREWLENYFKRQEPQTDWTRVQVCA
jgi:hypothetical protein